MRVARWADDVLPLYVVERQYWWDLWRDATRMRALNLPLEDQLARYGETRVPREYHGVAYDPVSPIEHYLSSENDRPALRALAARQQARRNELREDLDYDKCSETMRMVPE